MNHGQSSLNIRTNRTKRWKSRTSGIIMLACRGIFIQIGLLPNTEFCRDLVKVNEKGEIMIAPDCSTDVSGIFACGDVTNAYGKRIVVASGEGAKAALRAKEYLSKRGESK